MNKSIGGTMLQVIDRLLEPEDPETIMTQAYVIVGALAMSLVSHGIYNVLSELAVLSRL